MRRFEYVLPRDLDEASAALRDAGVAKAGGIDLLDRMKEGVAAPERLVNLAGLRAPGDPPVAVSDRGARVNAFATLAEVAGHAELKKRWTALADAAAKTATPQVRNLATAGGNVLQEPRCWYYRSPEFSCLRKGGEGCPAFEGDNRYHAVLGYGPCPIVHPGNLGPALLALGAKAVIHGRDGPVPVAEIWADPADTSRIHRLEPGEILTGFRLPPVGRSAYVEVRHKQSFDWPLASAAVARTPEGAWRVVLGAVAPVPRRSARAEKLLGTGSPSSEAMQAAADAAVAGARPLAGNAHKVKLARVALIRALAAATGGGR